MSKKKGAIVDISDEVLKDTGTLNEDQLAAVAKEALEEIEEETSGKKKKEVEEQETDDEKKEREEAEADEEKEDEEAEALAKEKEEAENKDRDKLDKRAEVAGLEKGSSLDDIKAAEEEAAEDKETKDKESKEKADALKKEQKETFEADVKAYVEAEKVPEEEARQIVESVGKIREKYKDDPKQLAKANLYIQRLYSKTQADLKSLRETPPSQPHEDITVEKLVEAIHAGKLTRKDNKTAVQPEELIEAYREDNPDVTEGMEDDTVLKLVAKEMKSTFAKTQKDTIVQRSSDAKEQRATLLGSLKEEHKRFVPDIKPILENLPDAQVLSEGYSLESLITYAKGVHADDDIKKAIEETEKRMAEKPEILGIKPKVGSTKPPKKKGDLSRDLLDWEKERAKDMFDGQDMTESEMFKDYLEIHPEAPEE